MKANYGYKDGSGDFFITVDSDKCNGCGDCTTACPAGVLELVENEYDIEAEEPIASVRAEHSKKIKYSCAPCKGASGDNIADLPCVKACAAGAMEHSW
jgi:Fe-S-cluster-containing hydrogenase component 2